jgi:ApbE superfamily uncharacterized protein (UPF0280 family)
MTAVCRLISGNRLHLQHGPIDLVIGADGDAGQVEAAYVAAAEAFPGILPALVAELAILRTPLPHPRCNAGAWPRDPSCTGPVARRMHAAVWPYRDRFITPMAAVAGSVADHVLGVMLRSADLRRAYVNNGGDIALHLAPGAAFTAGVVGDLASPAVDARVAIRAGDGVGGIATSGWRGRSQSLGIADAVTVLARDAATADAAATMIANAVNVDDPAIERRPAREVKDDSDLGDLPVTTAVGVLAAAARGQALAAGQLRATELLGQNLIVAAYIQLQGEIVVAGGNRLAARAA